MWRTVFKMKEMVTISVGNVPIERHCLVIKRVLRKHDDTQKREHKPKEGIAHGHRSRYRGSVPRGTSASSIMMPPASLVN